MILLGTYRLYYTLDKKLEELVVRVELKRYDMLLKPRQNIYYGIARVNGSDYKKKDLSHCVNAKIMAEEIGHELRDEIKKNSKIDGKSFRFKEEKLTEK
jgi:hypothetical protein